MGMTGIDRGEALLVASRNYPLNSKIRADNKAQGDSDEAMYAQYASRMQYAFA